MDAAGFGLIRASGGSGQIETVWPRWHSGLPQVQCCGVPLTRTDTVTEWQKGQDTLREYVGIVGPGR